MRMQEQTLLEFSDNTASQAPTPGGGSVAAAVGAFGAALAQMSANLTKDKRGYESCRILMETVAIRGDEMRLRLLSLIDDDCRAFEGYMAALAMPKNTDEEKEARRAALREAAMNSALAPLHIAQTAAMMLPLCLLAVEKGNKAAVTDAVMSVILCRAAIRSAVLNVKINLPSIGDETAANELLEECNELEREAAAAEEKALALSGF